jgi:glycosyltransferase involved in cell wall biosynthesis
LALTPASPAGWLACAAAAGRIRAAERRAPRSEARLPAVHAAIDTMDAALVEETIPRSHPHGRLLAERLGLDVRSDALERWLIPLHAVRLRRALARARVDVCVVDLPWDGAAAVYGRAGARPALVWYVQSSRSPGAGEATIRAFADRIVACGRDVGEARLGARARYEVVANGVALDELSPEREGRRPAALAALDERAVVVGMAGSLSRDKGVDVLLRACLRLFRRMPDLHLVLLGRGEPPFERALVRRAAASGFGDRLHLPGYQPHLGAILPHLSVFVLPSRFEGLPLSLCEAMACGVPCIASDIPGCREVARGGGVVLVPFGDAGALAEAIADLAASPATRERLGALGRRNVVQNYSFARTLAGFQAILLETS